MKQAKTYEIISDEGLFCKCEHLADGRVRLIGKNASIMLDELQKKALNPVYAQKFREKRSGRLISN